MYESPVVVSGHQVTDKMLVPSIGQVVTKVGNLAARHQTVSFGGTGKTQESNFSHNFGHHRFNSSTVDTTTNASIIAKDFERDDEDRENREPVISDDLPPSYDEVADSELIVQQIATRIEDELKEAKRTRLDCGEVLIPCNLTHQIAQDIVTMSESEPCGLRGGVMYINLEESDHSDLRRVGCVKLGQSVPTFEMYLNLKRCSGSWINQIFSNRLFKNFNKSSIVISDGYQLSKKKLYRSDSISV